LQGLIIFMASVTECQIVTDCRIIVNFNRVEDGCFDAVGSRLPLEMMHYCFVSNYYCRDTFSNRRATEGATGVDAL